MRKVVVPMRLSELCIAHLPGVVEVEVRFDVLAEFQGLQRVDRDLRRQVDLSLVIEHLAQQSLEFGAHFEALDFHFYLSLV